MDVVICNRAVFSSDSCHAAIITATLRSQGMEVARTERTEAADPPISLPKCGSSFFLKHYSERALEACC